MLNGLQKLEYRGYDSAGVAVYNDTGVHVVKSKGAFERAGRHPPGRQRAARHRGHRPHPVGHPWGPFRRQLPPPGQRRGPVRRGAQRHHRKLFVPEKHLIRRGVEFVSDTDTEVVAQMLEYYYKGDVLETIQKVISQGGGQLCVGHHLRRLPGPHFRRAEGQPPDHRHRGRGELYRFGCPCHPLPHPGHLPAEGPGDRRPHPGHHRLLQPGAGAHPEGTGAHPVGTSPRRKRAATSTS